MGELKMSKIFFTADTHFGQLRTLEFSKRPWMDTKSMDAALIQNWNAVVDKDDIVYHLGDFGETYRISNLRGKIHLLPGNYDTGKDFFDKMMFHGAKIHFGAYIELELEGQKFVLTHKPLEGIPKDKFVLFGHIHKLQMIKRNGLNVGIDCHNFSPISLETVLFYKNAIENHYDENVFCERCGL